MTREEAKREFWKKNGVFDKLFEYCFDRVLKLPYKGSVIDIFIDKIYDDFENRTCENCKYYKEEESYCKNEENEVFEFDNYKKMKVPDWKFGCNRFERKKYD